MKLKKLMLMIFLTVLPIVTISAQQSTMKNSTSENELGIDLNKTYSGNEVAEIIKIILEEADISIENAYAEGYKQATLELKPTLIISQDELNKMKKNSIQDKVISFSIGFCGGFITELLINQINSK